jgi:hypothetical protein
LDKCVLAVCSVTLASCASSVAVTAFRSRGSQHVRARRIPDQRGDAGNIRAFFHSSILDKHLRSASPGSYEQNRSARMNVEHNLKAEFTSPGTIGPFVEDRLTFSSKLQ